MLLFLNYRFTEKRTHSEQRANICISPQVLVTTTTNRFSSVSPQAPVCAVDGRLWFLWGDLLPLAGPQLYANSPTQEIGSGDNVACFRDNAPDKRHHRPKLYTYKCVAISGHTSSYQLTCFISKR